MRRARKHIYATTIAVATLGVLAAILCLTVAAPGAWAQATTPKAYVTDMAGYNGQVKALIIDQIGKVVRQRLDSDPTVTVVPKLEAGGGGLVSSPAIAEAMRLYEAGRGQFVNQNYDTAAQNLSKALEYFDGNIADITDWDVVESVLFRLSVAYFQTGGRDKADELISRLVAYNPDFAVSTDEDLAPEYHKAFLDVQKAQKKRGTGDLDTSSVAPGAEIWVDGKLRGVTPMTIEKLSAGTHYVKFVIATSSSGAMVTIERKKTTNATAQLDAQVGGVSPARAVIAALEDGSVGEDVRFAMRDLANRTAVAVVVTALIVPLRDGYAVQPFVYVSETATMRKLDAVVFDAELLSINVDGYKLSRQLIDAIYDASKGTAVASFVVTPDDYQERAQVAAMATEETDTSETTTTDTTQQDTTHTVAVKKTEDPELIKGFEPVEESWYQDPWVWTGIGAGIVAIAGTAAVLMMVEPSGDTVTGFNATVEW